LIVGLVVVVFILITKPVIIIQTLTTPIALAIVVAIGIGVALITPLLRRFGTPAPIRAGVLAVVYLLLGYLLLWPFYEADVFPVAANQAAAPAPMPSAGPAATSTGNFEGLDGHRGSGKASLIQVAEGSYVVRFAGVDIGSGPDLRVYLVPGSNQESPGSAVELDQTRGVYRGDHNFTVPTSVDVATGEPYTVLVWCWMFQVPVAAATVT